MKLLIILGGTIAIALIVFLVYTVYERTRPPVERISLSREGSEMIFGSPAVQPEDIEIVNPDGFYGQILEGLKSLKSGIDYREYEVVCQVPTQKDGETIASIINGELSAYGDGIATISIPSTVVELMMKLDKNNEESFKVSPNYIYESQAYGTSTGIGDVSDGSVVYKKIGGE